MNRLGHRDRGTGTRVATRPPLTGGGPQVTYGNWPPYHHAGDLGPGDVDGQGVDGVRFTVRPNGKLVRTTGN